MDISGCNAAQRQVIQTLPGPLFVAAGAGSGKTFTLKLRTANAFSQNESGFTLDSISEVLAITFTEKAAEELLARIKDTLFKEGFVEQARQADTAWISTIHGFCARLLRENALELGMDPEFRMGSERELEHLRLQAREAVLAQVRSGQVQLPPVFWNWELVSSSRAHGLMDEAEMLLDKIAALPNGLGALHHEERSVDPKRIAQGLLAVGQALLETTRSWPKPPHRTHEQPKVDALEEVLERTRIWLEGSDADLSLSDPDFDAAAYWKLLKAYPVLSPGFGKNKEGQDVIYRYKRVATNAVYEVAAALGMEVADAAAILAEALGREFARLKREANVVDNDDLIQLALDALRNNPHLAERYRQQFRLIMVDEFQDTNLVQIEIVRLLAQPKMANVCVVGDAQQSIYRFRGADVNSFTEYRDVLAEEFSDLSEEVLQPKLAENFRSHKDILAFVDAVFSQNSSFGRDYLKLVPKGRVNEEEDPVLDAQHRVTLDAIHYRMGDDGIRAAAALRDGAARIARHFADLKRRYAEAGCQDKHTYALLLGTTKNAQVYIDALRAEGLDSMMTSGSILMSTDEAKLVLALLRFAVNAHDEQPLYECLSSDLFAVSDDVLLALANRKDGDEVQARSLWRGFASEGALEEYGIEPDEVAAFQVARAALLRFSSRAHRGQLSFAVRKILVESGYLDRLRAQGVTGIASAGNLSKLIGMIEEVEQAHAGLTERVSAFVAKSRHAKESPGVLSVLESDFVQIMTVHGSKGLQFDHVALAEIKTGAERQQPFLVEKEGDELYVLSTKGLSIDRYMQETAADMMADERITHLADAKSLGQLRIALEQAAKREAHAEARRLLYVGFTRAVRSLYLSFTTNTLLKSANNLPYARDGVMQEVHEAIQWDTTAAPVLDTQVCTYSGSRSVRVILEYLDKDPDAALRLSEAAPAPEVHHDASQPFDIPVRPLLEMPLMSPSAMERANVRSYSSLTHDALDEPDSEAPFVAAWDGADALLDEQGLVHEADEDATCLGTAFHRLAERAILARAARGGQSGVLLEQPDERAVAAQEEKLGLSDGQRQRLQRALDGWFSSDVACELCSHDALQAEVPFMIRIQTSQGARFLEGEIDALATSGSAAFLVDYKTGGSAQETPEQIREKHRLQAQCYAYALLRSGFATVKATFVRVEQLGSDGMPQTVTYEFSTDDVPVLERSILDRWP